MSRIRREVAAGLAALVLLGPALGAGGKSHEPDVAFIPTPREAVDRMLQLAELKKGDVLYDLGCGDGRIVVTAARRYGVRAFGFDIDPERVRESRVNAAHNRVGDLVTIRQADIFTLDLSGADVVTLYLLPRLNEKLIPQLERLRPGSRIVSHDFPIPGVRAQQVERIQLRDGREHLVYRWVTPLRRER